jgi:hypothetical protein
MFGWWLYNRLSGNNKRRIQRAMWGVSESREPIKGKFAKKLIEEVAKIREQKMKKDYISNEKFDEEVDKTFHNIIIENDN